MSVLLAAGLSPLAAAVLLLALTPLLDRVRRRALRRIVHDAAEVLNAHGVDYWCDFGTLLGLHREGDVILGDKDGDLCLLEEEKAKVLALGDSFGARGLWVAEVPGKRGLVRIRDRRTPYYVDVYQYVREGETLRSLIMPGQEDVPESLLEKRSPLPFLGTFLRAPTDVPALLRHRYGPGFMVPRRNDKGATRPFSRLRSLGEDLEYGCIGVWGLLRALSRGLGE